MNSALWLLVGLALGGAIAWFVARKVGFAQSSAIESELRTQLQQRETDLAATRIKLSETEQQRAATEVQAGRSLDLERGLNEAQAIIAALNERAGKAGAEAAAAAQQLAQQQTQHERALGELEGKFKALSVEALDKNSKAFLTLAQEALGRFQAMAKGDLTERQQAIEILVKPLQESLRNYQERLQQGDSQQSKVLGALHEQVRALAEQSARLQTEAGHLVSALKTPKVGGRWGELTLQRVVEVAGLSKYCDFDTQVSRDTEEGRLRPDLVVHLPQNRSVVVDSKVPLKAYLEAIEATDETIRQTALGRHAQTVRKHMRDLSGKAYWNQFENTPEFVVLFLPGESFFSAALEQDREIVEDGLRSSVLVATPITLIALLRTVAASWQQQDQAANSQKIAEAGAELFDRLSKFADHLDHIRKGLQTAMDSFDEATGSFNRMLIPSARRLKELHVVPESRPLPKAQNFERTLPLPLSEDET